MWNIAIKFKWHLQVYILFGDFQQSFILTCKIIQSPVDKELKTNANAAKDASRRRQRCAWLNAWCPRLLTLQKHEPSWRTHFSSVHCSHAAALLSYTNVSSRFSFLTMSCISFSLRARPSLYPTIYSRRRVFLCHAANVAVQREYVLSTRSLYLARARNVTRSSPVCALYAFLHASLPANSRKRISLSTLLQWYRFLEHLLGKEARLNFVTIGYLNFN